MKQISKNEIQKLFDNKYIFNTKKGIVDKNGNSVGFYRTTHRWYIEDRFKLIAQNL